MMEINEQDIFNYVFFPDKVTTEVKNAIKQDADLAEAVDFYREMNAELKSFISRSLKEKIASKIPAYKLNNVLHLFPLPLPSGKSPAGRRLAADSESRHLISKLTSRTFADEDKEYMIKVINHESGTKVFVFSVKNDIVKNFDIIIEPKDQRYHFKDNSQPLIINREIEIDSIRLEFNKKG